MCLQSIFLVRAKRSTLLEVHYNYQCNSILPTLALMTSILSKKISGSEKDENTPKSPGCSVWVNKFLQQIPVISLKISREDLNPSENGL